MILTILVVLLIFFVAMWAISVLPLPATGFPLRTLLFFIAAVLLILYLIRFV